MESTNHTFFVENTKAFKNKMLNWANQFNIFAFLDNNEYEFDKPRFNCLLAIGEKASIELSNNDLFQQLKQFHTIHPEWMFGHINYPSAYKDIQEFPQGFFFVPEVMIQLEHQQAILISSSKNVTQIFNEINAQSNHFSNENDNPINFQEELSQNEYIKKISALQQHIQRGDCYEINFCHSFFAENVLINPLHIYEQLTDVSPNPFAALYKLKDKFCLCASPERFIKKTGNNIISQPIKGTSKRNLHNPQEDEAAKSFLFNNAKDRSENVMIVDLVRNDLGKVCKDGSVRVKELFGVYSFPQVHQMISTIEGELEKDIHWTDAIQACYPMGSMTGAPKKRVMELIEQYENHPRGLFSGSIGYVTPEGDVDFNVVIRSIYYNQTQQTISIKVGSGITIYSNPNDEYDECMMKVNAIKKIFN